MPTGEKAAADRAVTREIIAQNDREGIPNLEWGSNGNAQDQEQHTL